MKKILTTSIFIVANLLLSAQSNIAEGTVSTYLHIKVIKNGMYGYGNKNIYSFELTNIDTSGKPNWKSQEIREFEKEEDGYFVKVNVPADLHSNSSQMWCAAKSVKHGLFNTDTVKIEYGGVKLSNIKLILKSDPAGAETYLIPNRIWLKSLKNIPIEKVDPLIQKYRVNTAMTNTYALVDETVFVVLFKMNNKIKQITHSTKPYIVEQEQTIWVNF